MNVKGRLREIPLGGLLPIARLFQIHLTVSASLFAG